MNWFGIYLARYKQAESAWESVQDSAVIFQMSRQEYINRYLAMFDPITTTCGNTVPIDFKLVFDHAALGDIGLGFSR